jgi:Legionella pneumophila major outer membrane protein precursor
MKVNLIKLTFLFSFIFMSFIFSEIYSHEEEGEVSKSSPQEMQDYSMNYDDKTNSCDNMCFKPRCSCDQDYKRCCYGLPLPAKCGWFFLEGEYLYWKTYTVIPYANVREPVPPFTFSDGEVYSDEMKVVNMSADSGYRLTLGFYFSNCFFGRAQYRYFAADGKDNVIDLGIDRFGTNLSNFDIPWDIYSLASGATGAFTLDARQRHREKVVDLDFNRAFNCGRFSFTPYMGVRFAWIKSDLRIDYIRTPDDVFEISNHIDVIKHMNLGVGLRSGIDTNTDLCWGLGIYTTSSISALVGQFQREIRNEMVNVNNSPNVRATISQNYKVTDFQTSFQLGAGFNWGAHFCKCRYYVGVNIGYEANVWPNFFDNFNALSNSNLASFNFRFYSRSLLTHGLTAGLRFDF